MSALRLLIRPTLFTVGVCGTCYCGAAIFQYENRKRPFPATLTDWVATRRQRQTAFNQKYLNFRQKINEWANRLSTGQKIACGTIFINFLVLCAWHKTALRPLMIQFFMCQSNPALSKKIPLSPMILSCFSHSMPLHFIFNMWCLYSFAPYANALLGPEQLVGLYLSAGVVSSLTSLAHRLATKRTVGSLGASGALLGVISYICVARPETGLLLFFVPITAGNAIKAIMALDVVGLIARWKFIDHAAHLGGSLFGVWYALKGEKLFYEHRKTVVNNWLELKSKFSKDD